MIDAVVAIVGQPNVGKSTLFNRLIGERLSIVLDEPGVTRDRLYGTCEWLLKKLRFVDTGGIVLKDMPFQKEIMMQVEIALDEADIIVYVVDATIGLDQTDRVIAKKLHASNKPVILAANKIDDGSKQELMFDYYALGFERVIATSSAHGIGIGDLLDTCIEFLPPKRKRSNDDALKFSIIGRPNVGKSSLVNAILNQERVIISEIEGTTRDAIDTDFVVNEQPYTIIDTAGIRKRGKIYEKIEKYALLRSMSAIERSDVVLFVIDASVPIIDLDKHVAGYAHEMNKPIIIVLNKWDDVERDEHTFHVMQAKVREEFLYLSYAPIVTVSALTKQRVHQIIPLVNQVFESASLRISTSVLNEVIMNAITMTPPPTHQGKRLKVSYMTQVGVNPPTFLLFVNDPELLHFSYKRYLENKIRESFGFVGTPIVIKARGKEE